MELNHEFRVGIPVQDAWKVLTDVERIAPHMPGAQLQEVQGDEYRGIVKVKVGPITAQYKGAATFLEQDQGAGRVVLKASGRDTRGQGNANATITATLQPDGDGTKVAVATDLTVTGKVAQFGRGVMADVSSKLLGQFVDSLEKDLQQSGEAAGAGSTTSQESEPAVTNGPPVQESEPAVTAGPPVRESSTNGATPGEPAAAGPGGPEALSGPPATGGASTVAGGSPASPLTAQTSATATAAPAPAGADRSADAPSAVRRISAPEPKPVDLLQAAGGSVAKRVVPLAGLAALILLLVVWLRRRS
jgi:carbon monoxide dehydrogenase subunit G